jgi:hypothetical protein
VANHFGVVPVRTDDESCIVVRVVVRAQTRRTIVFATRLQSRAIESFDLLAILGRERQVKMRQLLLSLVEAAALTASVQADNMLVTPDNHAMLLIDNQFLQFLALRSRPTETVVNNTTLLAKATSICNVPTELTTAFAERQALFEEVQAVYPEQTPVDRMGLNFWNVSASPP